jgi:hypothetical protein
MDTPRQASLTAEQLAAVNAGGGFAQFVDPTSNFVYYLIKQTDPPTINDQYVREKIEEAYANAAEHGFEPLDMAKIKAELSRRIATGIKTLQ